MWISHRKEIWKLTFRALALRRGKIKFANNWINVGVFSADFKDFFHVF